MPEHSISPLAFIGEGVIVGKRVSIGPGAVILGPCVIEDDVFIGSGAHIGAPPEMTTEIQNSAWAGELSHAGVRICTRAVIREGAVVHQGSHRETTVGASSWILNRAYLAHDVVVGEHTTISAGVSIGGHCTIGDRVNIGMNATVHQRTFVSTGCMIGMSTPLTRDLPPFVKAYGSPARIQGVNAVGMQRLGIEPESISLLEDAYANVGLLLDAPLEKLQEPLLSAVLQWQAQDGRRPATLARL